MTDDDDDGLHTCLQTLLINVIGHGTLTLNESWRQQSEGQKHTVMHQR